MSKITIANRKFLEEQVRLVLKEEYSSIAADLNPRSVSGQQESITNALTKELIDYPIYLLKVGNRKVVHGGSFYRQAVKGTNLKSKLNKNFFSMYRPSVPFSPIEIISEEDKIFNKKKYKIHQELRSIILDMKKTSEKESKEQPRDKNVNYVASAKVKRDLYGKLLSFFKSMGTANVVLVDQKTALKGIRAPKTFDNYAISLFKRSRTDESENELSDPYKDVFDFISQDKEALIDELRKNEKKEFVAFVMKTHIGPRDKDGLKLYLEAMQKIKDNPNMNPVNVVRGIGQVGLGIAIEKSIERRVTKKPLTWWKSLGLGVAVAVGLYAIDKNLNIPGITIKSDLEEIQKLVSEAVRIAKKGEKRELKPEEEKQVKNKISSAIEIVVNQFSKNLESEGFMMTIEDKVSAFQQMTNSLAKVKKTFDYESFSINKDTYPRVFRELKALEKMLIQIYSEYEVPLSAYSPLEENAVEKSKKRTAAAAAAQEVIKIGGELTIKREELTISKLNEENVKQLVKWYNLDSSNYLRKLEKIKELDDYLTNSYEFGIKNSSEYSSQFKREWENRITSMASSYEPGQLPSFLTKGYERLGMSYTFSGRGGLFPSSKQISLVFTPLLHRLESNTAFIITAGKFSDLDSLFAGLEKASVNPNHKIFGNSNYNLLSNSKIVPKVVSNISVTSEDFEEAANLLAKEGIQGNLNILLKIHLLFKETVLRFFKGLQLIADSANKKIEKADKSISNDGDIPGTLRKTRKLALLRFGVIYAYSGLDLFMKENKISFL